MRVRAPISDFVLGAPQPEAGACAGLEDAGPFRAAIEACAQRVASGQPMTLEFLWARASEAVSNHFLDRRNLSAQMRPTRSQIDLMAFAQEMREHAEPGFATAHAEYTRTRADSIAPRLLGLADYLRQPEHYVPALEAWIAGDYRLVRVPAPVFEISANPARLSFELRIHTPSLGGGEPAAFAAWRLKVTDLGGPLQLGHRLFDNPDFAEPLFQRALHGQVNQLLRAMVQAPDVPTRLQRAYEAFWWMLRQTQIAVGDKALFVMETMFRVAGLPLTRPPSGIDPVLEALSHSLPDWSVRAPEIWGHGFTPAQLLWRELGCRLPAAARHTQASQGALPAPEMMPESSQASRRRRAQIEAEWAGRERRV